MKAILITGINRGLGEAFFNHYIEQKNCLVIGISRRINEQQKALLKEGRFIYVKLDLSKFSNPEKELKLSSYFDKVEEVLYINNAATVSPVSDIGKYGNKDVSTVIRLNTLAPFLITNYIIANTVNKKVTFMNISSGAAKNPIEGWSLYCATKAANEMFYATLETQEKDNPNISVINVNPGVIDSGMQEQIRSSQKSTFPRLDEFIKMKEEGKLVAPIDVVRRILSENPTI